MERGVLCNIPQVHIAKGNTTKNETREILPEKTNKKKKKKEKG